jgi:ankyrin repeat protein
MFYDIEKAIEACDEEPSLLFEAIKCNYRDVYEKVLEKENFDFNLEDENGDNVLIRLLKNKDYDLVCKYIEKKDIDINHQNIDGDTIAHFLVMHNYVDVKEILEKLLERKDFIPNIKNNKNETILDKSLNNHYLYATMKILGDKRFNNIGLLSFKNLYETYIKSNNYGTYSKMNNFELIFNSLKKKELMPIMSKLIKLIKKDEVVIKNDFIKAKTESLDTIINHLIEETI